jgi:hypothetical protein
MTKKIAIFLTVIILIASVTANRFIQPDLFSHIIKKEKFEEEYNKSPFIKGLKCLNNVDGLQSR